MAQWWENDPVAQAVQPQAVEWWKNDPVAGPSPEQQAEADVKSGANQPDFRPQSSWFQRFSDQVMDPFGVQDEIVGAGQAIRSFATSDKPLIDPERLNEAGKAYTDAAERIRAERRVARGENTVIPEIVGGFGTSGVAKAVGAAPGLLEGIKQSAKVGAGMGAATGFAQGEGGLGQRAVSAVEGGTVGAVAAPAVTHLALPLATRAMGAMKDAVRYGNRAVRNAMDPEQAAINNVADRMVSQGIDPAAVRAEISPPPSPNLASRTTPAGKPFGPDDMADIVSRGLKGESAKDIAQAYGIHESTVRSYLTKYRNSNPTERNLLDIATDMAGEGTAKPLTRLARAAHSLSDDGEAAQRLLSRQETQAGRVNNIIDRAGAGRNFDDEIAKLDDVVSNQARQAYGAAEANAQPFDLKPAIGKFRRMAFGRAGELREKTEQAIDAMFEPVMGPNGKVLKLGQPIADVKRFQAARQDLDQMIARSMQDGRPTPLTRVLTQFRQEVTGIVRKANPELAKADDMFSGAKSSEKLLEEGAKLSGRLGAPSRQLLDGFEKLSTEQQELIRLGFLRNLQDKSSNIREGAAVANQFNSPAVRQTIERLFPKKDKATWERGQALIKHLKQEATTTRVKNEVLSGSRTAELGADMDKFQQGAQAAADIATGRWGQFIANLGTRLTSQIGERGSKEVLEVLTQTDPAKLLPTLNRLAAAAKTTQDRQALVTTIRELRAANIPGVSGVVGQASGRQNSQK